ncbi:hypothetical protein [Bradyrhizobium sp. WD16]|uniref:hypothetical protein n=1 Tax=Bradyrhizobium sp. WD16 TaxID=1521768 RepID=UPI0020A4EC04|nr:hypothetical protein [Bradyrhizobium sp. WD16]UTD25580.1 hypothetical protein DB459_00310 [Bradyrhizobium sp. WD16]
MVDTLVDSQNNLKRMNDAKRLARFEARQRHAARSSFMPVVMKSGRLKPIEAQNASLLGVR